MEVTSLYREPEVATGEVEWPALELIDVFKLFRADTVETVALRGLHLRIERSEFVAILGPSGSGKSTFLHLAAGIDDASAGEVRAFGQPLGRLDEGGLSAYRARTVALILQSDNLWPELTARENVIVTLKLAGMKDAGRRADAALSMFGLERRGDHRTAALSGGEQQRVAIAAAAAREAPLVLADEPTGELDAANEQIVLACLHRLRDECGSTVVTVTHSRLVAESADRMVTFRDGRAEADR